MDQLTSMKLHGQFGRGTSDKKQVQVDPRHLKVEVAE